MFCFCRFYVACGAEYLCESIPHPTVRGLHHYGGVSGTATTLVFLLSSGVHATRVLWVE